MSCIFSPSLEKHPSPLSPTSYKRDRAEQSSCPLNFELPQGGSRGQGQRLQAGGFGQTDQGCLTPSERLFLDLPAAASKTTKPCKVSTRPKQEQAFQFPCSFPFG